MTETAYVRPDRVNWFGTSILVMLLVVIGALIAALLMSDTNRSLRPVGVFQLGEKTNTLECHQDTERTDCPSPAVTVEDVRNGYVRSLE